MKLTTENKAQLWSLIERSDRNVGDTLCAFIKGTVNDSIRKDLFGLYQTLNEGDIEIIDSLIGEELWSIL